MRGEWERALRGVKLFLHEREFHGSTVEVAGADTEMARGRVMLDSHAASWYTVVEMRKG